TELAVTLVAAYQNVFRSLSRTFSLYLPLSIIGFSVFLTTGCIVLQRVTWTFSLDAIENRIARLEHEEKAEQQRKEAERQAEIARIHEEERQKQAAIEEEKAKEALQIEKQKRLAREQELQAEQEEKALKRRAREIALEKEKERLAEEKKR